MDTELSQVLVSRVSRLMYAVVPWINDLDCTDPAWTMSEAAARRFRELHFFGYYRYHCSVENKTAVVKYCAEGLEEISYHSTPEGVQILYSCLPQGVSPKKVSRPATIRDLYGLLKLA